ncbi:M3 family metallopeptidase [Bacillus sp. JJ722]|uniref:M3 family metallopeptidase n=1 Tax=Bacillus sp. JJ722 TaxID=3122973 RepID=UPI002FFE6358
MNKEQFEAWSKTIVQKDFLSELCNESLIEQDKSVSNFTRETLKGLEDIYSQFCSNMIVTNKNKDIEYSLTFYDAIYLSLSHSNQLGRIQVFNELNCTLEKQSNIFASIYNQMVGTRLYENQINTSDYFQESLKMNGLSQTALNTMWDVVESNLHKLCEFLQIKAIEKNKEKISWHEFMTMSQEVPYQIDFSVAIDQIVKALNKIDSRMADFSKYAIHNRWVDTEPRSTKSTSGFCAPFINEGESRISVKYDNSIESARILAHELGHAWHFKQLKNIGSFRFLEETLEMTTAETASIFFETVFIDFMIDDTKDKRLKKDLIDWKIKRSLNYLMSIRGAYLFERKFYERRKNGPLSAKHIEELSLDCQKEAYDNCLSEYEPFVWIKYEQFYQADTPFYNYPYSFGFLLSIGLIDIAEENNEFPQKFKEFLRETGSIPIEQLVKKYFDKDISKPEFWEQSLQRILADIDQYKKLT